MASRQNNFVSFLVITLQFTVGKGFTVNFCMYQGEKVRWAVYLSIRHMLHPVPLPRKVLMVLGFKFIVFFNATKSFLEHTWYQGDGCQPMSKLLPVHMTLQESNLASLLGKINFNNKKQAAIEGTYLSKWRPMTLATWK